MKKINIRNLVCLCAVMMSSVTYAIKPLTIESFEIDANETKIIQVIGSDIVPLTGFQTEISLPDGLSFISFGNEYAEIESTCSISESPELFMISTSLQGNTLKIVSYTLDHSSCYSKNEPWFRIKVKSSDRFDSGKITIHDTYVTSIYSLGAQYNQDKEWKLDDVEYIVTRVVKPQKIQLSQESLELKVGESAIINAEVFPETATDKTIIWTSSNDAVATVIDGTIQGLKAGICTITASASNGITASCEVTVTQPAKGVALSETNLELYLGESKTLTATIYPEDTEDKSLTWRSSDNSVVEVSENGNIKTLKEGEATVTVETVNGLSADCQVTVIAAIKLDYSYLPVITGLTDQLEVINIINTDKNYRWSSSDESIVTVDDNGVLTPLSSGIAIICVENQAGYKAYCEVIVIQGPTGVLITEPQITLKAGSSKQLDYKVEPDNMLVQFELDKLEGWESHNPLVVSVNKNGYITANTPGNTTITAQTVNFINVSWEIEVIPLTESFYFEPEALSMQVGENKRISPIISPAEVLGKDMIWESSDSRICSVENGVVSAHSAGNCIIRAITFDGISASCSVVVTQPVDGLVLSFSELEINVGDEFTLNATLYPEDASDKTINWKTSDEEIATVMNGVITGLKAGTCTITASTSTGITASCNLTVIQTAEEIILSETVLELDEGEMFTLKAEVMPEDASDKSLTWSSSDNSVAEVDMNGTISAIHAGEALITATAHNGISASCQVTIKEIVGINSIGTDNVRISVEGNKLLIDGASKLNCRVMLYSIDGRVIYSGNDEVIESLSPGIYIIRIGNKSMKIAIR